MWILFLNTDGTVKSHQKISNTQGGFTGALDNQDWFGSGVSSLGDLDGDGVGDLAVGQTGNDGGGPERGAVWILHLDTDGTVKSHQKISNTQGGFLGTIDDGDTFPLGMAALGDLSGNGGVGDLAVTAAEDNDGGLNVGAVWILFLPEPDPTLLLVSAIGSLIVLHRIQRRHPCYTAELTATRSATWFSLEDGRSSRASGRRQQARSRAAAKRPSQPSRGIRS